MNLKMIKSKTQENIISIIKSMVNERVTVQCNYDLENEVISLLLAEEIKQEEVVERIIIYSCVYRREQDSLSVTGFARRYGYDAFGISTITNEPVTVDEAFMSGIKGGIYAGLNAPIEEDTPAPAPANAE